MAQLRAAGGGYGKGSKRPDHRKMAQRDKRRLQSGATMGRSLSSRMVSSQTAASEELLSMAYDKDRRAAHNLPPLDKDTNMNYTRLAPTAEELGLLPVPSGEVALRMPVTRDQYRHDHVVDGVPDTFVATQPSALAAELIEKEEEMARMLSLSNPTSRNSSRPGTKGKPRSREKKGSK